MNRIAIITGIVVVVSLAGVALGQDEAAGDPPQSWLEAVAQRETLTANWAGMGEQLEAQGIAIALSNTQIYQINLEGALATHRHSGRYTGGDDTLDNAVIMGVRAQMSF